MQRNEVSFSELVSRLEAFEDRYDVPTEHLELAFPKTRPEDDEDYMEWYSLRRIYNEGLRRRDG